MILNGHQVNDTRLLQYIVASADMKYIEVGEREVYLKQNVETGFLVQATLVGSDRTCCIDLAQILLEYSMTCEGHRDLQARNNQADQFGDHLGHLIAMKLLEKTSLRSASGQVFLVFETILNSMNVSYSRFETPSRILYSLDTCPLHKAAQGLVIGRDMPLAYQAFVALCAGALRTVAPGWAIVKPKANGTNPNLSEVVLEEL